MTPGGRTALVVVTSEAEAALAPWRNRHLHATVASGVPAHITVLFPFVAAQDLNAEVSDALRVLYARVALFDYDLASVESFPGVAWLAPDPAVPFLDLIAITRRAFPELPPYGDPGLEPVPHCTVGAAESPEGLAAIVAEVRAGLRAELPIRCRAEAVTLLEEHEDETWSARASFPLAGGA